MAFTNYQSFKVTLWAKLFLPGRVVNIDLLGASLSYMLNGIPNGQLQISLGRDVLNNNAANIHAVLDQLFVTYPVEVWMQVYRGPNSYGIEIESWPNTAFRVFVGRMTSVSSSVSRSQVNLTMSVDHWLCDLNFSSALTRSSSSVTPQQLTTLAAVQGGQGVQPGFTTATMANQWFTIARVQADLWGNSLGEWLRTLCEQDLLAEPVQGAIQENVEAKAALNRFEPFSTGQYRFGVPLQFPAAVAGIDSVISAVADDIVNEKFEVVLSATLWDKLLSIGANYRYAICPLVNTALVIPYTPGFRKHWCTIYGEEYDSISPSMTATRPIRGVRLFTGIGSPSGALGIQQGQIGPENAFGGEYINPDYPDGMLIFLNAPRWAANAAPPQVFGNDAIAALGLRGNALFPGAGAVPAQLQPGQIRVAMRNVWNAYAQNIYLAENLRGRRIILQGKLRFDIAPGSTVRVEVVQDKFVEAIIGKTAGSIMFGEVTQMTHEITSEGAACKTTFAIDNVRNSLENTKDSTSTDQNPFYAAAEWYGAPLVEDNAFIPPVKHPVFKL